MKTRPVAAAFFVVFCLLLCGIILRRQIAAHPLPPEARPQAGGGGQSFETDFRDWHAATPKMREEARDAVRGEISALRGGDALKAMSYRSRWIRRRFADPNEFLAVAVERHPELVHCRTVHFGPVWADTTGQAVRTVAWMEETDGEKVHGEFLLVREGGRLRIDRLQAQFLPK